MCGSILEQPTAQSEHNFWLKSPLQIKIKYVFVPLSVTRGGSRGGGPGARGPPLTTKNEAPAPKFYKTEAPEWQF